MSITPMATPVAPVSSRKSLRALATLPSRIRAAVQRHLDAQDELAERRELTITRGRWGSRTYRDPLFDLLVLEACAGSDAEDWR